MTTTQVLGKGLSALISEMSEPPTPHTQSLNNIQTPQGVNTLSGEFLELNVNELAASSFQPRKFFNEEKIYELTQSIAENGVLQPIIVLPKNKNGIYEIVAGERRWRASTAAKLKTIPAIVKELTPEQAIEFALVENIQRESLSPVEEAEGYRRLQDEYSYTQNDIAKEVGKSRSHIANMLRLLQLPKEVKDFLDEGLISLGHARALINAEKPATLAERIIEEGLSVRQAEKFAAGHGQQQRTAKQPKLRSTTTGPVFNANKDEDIIAIEESISDSLGLPVSIDNGEQGGQVTLRFQNLAELDKIIQKLVG